MKTKKVFTFYIYLCIIYMPKTVVHEKESIEDALRRFKRDVSRSGNLQEAKKRQYYLKPSDVRKQKRQEARKKYK